MVSSDSCVVAVLRAASDRKLGPYAELRPIGVGFVVKERVVFERSLLPCVYFSSGVKCVLLSSQPVRFSIQDTCRAGACFAR